MFRDFRPYQNNYESATTRATRHVKFTMELSFLKFFTKARARQKKSYIPPPSEVSHLIARHCSLARSLTLLVSISTRGWLARVSRGSSSCLRLSTERRKTLSRMGKLGGRSPSPRLPVLRLDNEETWTATWTRFFSSFSSLLYRRKEGDTRVEVSLATSKDKILEDPRLSLSLSFVFNRYSREKSGERVNETTPGI